MHLLTWIVRGVDQIRVPASMERLAVSDAFRYWLVRFARAEHFDETTWTASP